MSCMYSSHSVQLYIGCHKVFVDFLPLCTSVITYRFCPAPLVDWKFLETLRPQLLLFTHPAQIISYCSTGPAAGCQLLHYVGMWSRQNLLLNTKQQPLCSTSKIWCTTAFSCSWPCWLLICMCACTTVQRHSPQTPSLLNTTQTRAPYRFKPNGVQKYSPRQDDVIGVMGGKMWQAWKQVGCNRDNERRKTNVMRRWQIV